MQRMVAPVGLRNRLRSWVNGAATPPAPSPSRTAEDVNALHARVAQLELERPAFIAELNNMLDAVNDILQRTEGKRGRIAAAESKLRKRTDEATEQAELPLDRSGVLAQVREALRSQGKLH